MKLGPHPHDLFNLNYLLKGPTSKYSKSHDWNWEGTQFSAWRLAFQAFADGPLPSPHPAQHLASRLETTQDSDLQGCLRSMPSHKCKRSSRQTKSVSPPPAGAFPLEDWGFQKPSFCFSLPFN